MRVSWMERASIVEVQARGDAKILVADDLEPNVVVLQKIFKSAGYREVAVTTEAREVETLFERVGPDLVLLDLHLRHAAGPQLVNRLRTLVPPHDYVPFLVMAPDTTVESKQRALASGADDYITKPLDATEVLLRSANMIRTRFLHRSVRHHKSNLQSLVDARTDKLWAAMLRMEETQRKMRAAQEETIRRLAAAAEFRDRDTADHLGRMGRYCGMLARWAGLDEDSAEQIRLASSLHDVGKIGIPDSILLKPGAFTPEERMVMQSHTTIGHGILSGSPSDLLDAAAEIALTHHERVDGTGYPNGLNGAEIPLAGRIAAIADVFDALKSDRVYRDAYSFGEAVGIMREGAGTQFDAQLLDTFLDHLDEIEALESS